MILNHEDYQAIESEVAQGKATAIIQAFEKLEREQRVEVKKDLLMELATRADIAELRGATKADITRLEGKIDTSIAELRGATKADIAELRSEIKHLGMLVKVLIGLIVIGMSFFSPVTAEVIKIIVK